MEKTAFLQQWWVQVLFLLVLFVGTNLSIIGFLPPLNAIHEFLMQAVMPILLFYLCYNHFVPSFFMKGRYRLFFSSTVLAFILTAVISFFIVNYFIHHSVLQEIDVVKDDIFKKSPKKLFIVLCVNHFFVAFISSALKIMYEQWNERQKLLERQREHFKTELLLLKAQLNPHFLLNTLTNLYALTEIDTQKTQIAILKLADLLRYVLYESKQELVSLENEVEVLHAYIALHQIKYEQELSIFIDINEHVLKNVFIPPMLLIPLLENAFKHSGIGRVKEGFISLKIDKNEAGNLFILIKNQIATVSSQVLDDYSGIGLANIERRVTLLQSQKPIVFRYGAIQNVFEAEFII